MDRNEAAPGRAAPGRAAPGRAASGRAASGRAASGRAGSAASRTPTDRPQETGHHISDPGALRALAHAGRYAILERLQTDGPSTATECARSVGLSPSACSYHLRLLARHGLVEPDTNRSADGRERVWRATATGWWSDVDATAAPAAVQALDSTLTRVMMASSDAMTLAFTDQATREPEWRAAALFSNSTITVTPEELAAVSAALMDVLHPYLPSVRSANDIPSGARQVHVSIRTAPRVD